MKLTLLYFDGCPHWREGHSRLREAMGRVGLPDEALTLEAVETDERAQALGFHGSPTFLIDGEDPFGDSSAPVALACRVYPSETGLSGSPSAQQLVDQILQRL